MAISTDVIRRIKIQAETQGVDQATSALKGLSDAQGNVAVVSDTSAKRSLSAEAAYNRQTLSVVAGARAQADLEKALKVAQSALNQGIISADDHAKRVALLNDKYGQLSNQQKALGTVMQDLNGRVATATGSLGTMGQVLTAFGPAGIAVAAVAGTAALAINGMADASHALAEKAEGLRRFSDITGLTTAQVQALRMEAAKFGVSGDEAATAIEHFTASFNQLRLGQGDLLTQIKRVNPALADQMQMTTNAGDALTLFGKVLAQVDDIFQRNALVKAATGKGGLITAEYLTNLNVNGLTQSLIAADRGLSDGLIKSLPKAEQEINKLKSSMGDAFTKQFAQPLLDTELAVLQTMKSIGDAVASFKLSDDFKAFINFATMLPRAGINFAIDLAASFRTPTVQGSADRNDPLRRAAFQAPSRTTGMADLNDPLRALPSQAKTPEAIAAGLKDTVGLLGSAATLTEQYNAKVAELNTTENKAKLTEDERTRALKGIDLDFAIKRTAALNGILGVAATVQDQYVARLQQINKALMEGAPASDAQVTNAKRLALAQADGTFQLQAQINAQKVSTATIGMTTAQAEAYTIVQTKINENLNAGKPALDGVTDGFRKLAEQQGQAKQAGELAVELDKALFDAKTAMLSPLEREIALLQKRNGINPQTDEIASIKRTTDAMEDARKTAIGFGQDFAHSMLAGKSLADSLSSSLKNLSAKLTDKAIEQLLSGEWEKAAISGISAVATGLASLFTGDSAQALKDQISLIDKVSALQTRQIAATQDQSTLSGKLAAFDFGPSAANDNRRELPAAQPEPPQTRPESKAQRMRAA
jgi:hypothetical protein